MIIMHDYLHCHHFCNHHLPKSDTKDWSRTILLFSDFYIRICCICKLTLNLLIPTSRFIFRTLPVTRQCHRLSFCSEWEACLHQITSYKLNPWRKTPNSIWQVVQPAVQTCLKCNSLMCPTFCPQPRIWTLFNLVFEWTLFKPRENIQIFYLKPPQFWSIKLLKLQDLMEVQIWRHKMYGEIAAPTTKNIPPCYLSFLSRRPDSPALVH